MGIRLTGEETIDLHMHTTVSDGTDTPTEILRKVRDKKIHICSITDHDDNVGCIEALECLKAWNPKEDCPAFLTGAEFSSRDEGGKYHILAYGYDLAAKPIGRLVTKAHGYRMEKIKARMEGLSREYHFTFPEEEWKALFALRNPGKPHIGNLCVKYGYAPTKEVAIEKYINSLKTPNQVIGPKEIMEAILESGGIPVLAHPVFGSGSQMVVGEELEQRVLHLMEMGLLGLECFYSGFSGELIQETCHLAKRLGLYVTAGSDYHGTNKKVLMGANHYEGGGEIPEGMVAFFDRVKVYVGGELA